MAITVKKLAELSGVSVRALHFYDEIGLLKPAYLGENEYRYHKEAELLRLQQILFYRELGFKLEDIKAVLDAEGFKDYYAPFSPKLAEFLAASMKIYADKNL